MQQQQQQQHSIMQSGSPPPPPPPMVDVWKLRHQTAGSLCALSHTVIGHMSFHMATLSVPITTIVLFFACIAAAVAYSLLISPRSLSFFVNAVIVSSFIYPPPMIFVPSHHLYFGISSSFSAAQDGLICNRRWTGGTLLLTSWTVTWGAKAGNGTAE